MFNDCTTEELLDQFEQLALDAGPGPLRSALLDRPLTDRQMLRLLVMEERHHALTGT